MRDELRDEAHRGSFTRRRFFRRSGAGAAVTAAGVALTYPGSALAAGKPAAPTATTSRVRRVTAQGPRSAATMSADTETWVSITLAADTTVTVTPAAGGVIRYFVTQDSAGGHTFSVTDGQTTVVLPVQTVPGAGTALALYSPDGTNLFVGS